MESNQSNHGFCLLLVGYPMSGKRQIAERLEEQLAAGGEDVEFLTAGTLEQWFHLSPLPAQWTSSSCTPLVFCLNQLTSRGVCPMLAAAFTSLDPITVFDQNLERLQMIHVNSPLSFCRTRAEQRQPSHSGSQILKQFEKGDLTLEEPDSPLIRVNYEESSLDECVTEIIERLAANHLLDLDGGPSSSQEEEVKDRLKNLGYI